MDGRTESQSYANRGRPAVWEAIVLSAVLAAAPGAAWATEPVAARTSGELNAAAQAGASEGSAGQAQSE